MIEVQASTPEQFRSELVKWLQGEIVQTEVNGRMAVRKRVIKQHQEKAATLRWVSLTIAEMEINSLPKSKNCPNCGEEML